MNETPRHKSEEVTWDVDGIAVYGTRRCPTGPGPYPAVVLVAGSGPTDRNWCSPLLPGTNGSARLLANVLTQKGFVTLRYDKRASGPRVRENLPRLVGKTSMQGHVDELTGAVTALLSEPDVDASRLFVLTSSEGAIHALNYQTRVPRRRFTGLVLTGAPGRPVGVVARDQVLAQVAALADSDRMMKRYDDCIAAFVAGKAMQPDESLPVGVQKPFSQPCCPGKLAVRTRALAGESSRPCIAGIGADARSHRQEGYPGRLACRRRRAENRHREER
jgi:uncharacterized protein